MFGSVLQGKIVKAVLIVFCVTLVLTSPTLAAEYQYPLEDAREETMSANGGPLNGMSRPASSPNTLPSKLSSQYRSSLLGLTFPLVFKRPLALFSTQPMTGFHRDGYCRTGAADMGNHAVAGVVSEEFLDYTAKQGNDLRVVGLTGGCKWCLCTSRWFEAYSAYKDGRIGKEAVPKVALEATEDSALRKVDLKVFEEFKAE